MILTEQEHKNFYRPYYRGMIKNYDRSKAAFSKMYYLTTSFVYASFYAKTDGLVEEYRLKEKINIFNARSEKDYYTLRHFLLKDPKLNLFTTSLDRLKNEDWTFVLGYKNRDELADILIDLGYDGYFNFEYTKELKTDLEKRMEQIPIVGDEPAIGILNIGAFIKVKTYKGKPDFLQFDEYKQFVKNELLVIKNKAYDYYHKAHLTTDIITIIFSNGDYSFLTKNEVKEFVSNLDYKKLLEEHLLYIDYLKGWLDDRHLKMLNIE